ncbi:hypothetical protein CRYUN_Cryun38cG0037000 [Craigia yunnanensis]
MSPGEVDILNSHRLDGILFLELSSNSLSGSLPIDIGKWKCVTNLNLSENQFSGTIPSSIADLTDLTHLSLSGNEALCGSSRFQVPPCKTDHSRRSKSTEILKYILPGTGSAILILAMVIILLRSRNRKAEVPFQENLLPLAEWRRISYYELDQATNGFSESNLRGEGSFGSVYQGTLSDSMSIAVKVFNANLDRALGSFHVECEVFETFVIGIWSKSSVVALT